MIKIKQLYQCEAKATVYFVEKYGFKKRKQRIIKQSKYCDSWHYGEIPENSVMEYDDIHNLPIHTFIDKNDIVKISEYWLPNSIICISENEFYQLVMDMRYEVLDINRCSMSTLTNKLSVDDMIDYLKDRGMNTCPMM